MATTPKKFDLLVIGSGPAGEAAAINAAKACKRVGIINDKANPGGNCTYLGTIPIRMP
ncbi:MAG: FAD-dependent oxidoreductase [Gammaproteobacteria bacterium]|nr:FAD-dependent oxidoreductase [Gammaproteobacteria bacterium]